LVTFYLLNGNVDFYWIFEGNLIVKKDKKQHFTRLKIKHLQNVVFN